MRQEITKFDVIMLLVCITLAILTYISIPISNEEVIEPVTEPPTTTSANEPTEDIEAETEALEEVTVQKVQPVKPKYYIEWLDMEISKEDFELLCRTTYCEAGNQDLETQTMVCLTILNRYANEDIEAFQGSLRDVVYGENAYQVTTWIDFESKEWTEQVEQAVRNAMACNNHPTDMYYFRTEHYHPFGQPYKVSGDLLFSTEH